MKPGKTTLDHQTPGYGYAPIVTVGSDDRMVRVTFGTISFLLSAPPGSEGRIIIVRGEAYNERGESLPLRMHGVSDIRNQIEFHLKEANEP